MIETPRLLITRFAPHAQLLAEQLNNVGFFSISQPLLTVKTLTDDEILHRFKSGHYDLVIAVSGNAVKYSQLQVGNIWPTTIYLAVGRTTQLQLSTVTKQNVLCPTVNYDSEGLLALDELQQVKGKQVLILRGQGGRDLLEQTLVQRGAKVEFFQTYKRIPLDLDAYKLVDNWQQASINGAIISSIEILNQLFTLVPNKHHDWLLCLVLYVPSQRIADRAKLLGVQKIKVIPSLQADQIIKFLKEDKGSST